MKTHAVRTITGTGYVAIQGGECSPVFEFRSLAVLWAIVHGWI